MTPEELFEKYERLAHWYVCRFLPTREADEDYHQIAMIGLWKACRSYNDDKRYTFTTYAVACIRGEFKSYHGYIHREKRAGDLTLFSIDRLISGDNGEEENPLSDMIGDPESLKEYESIFDKDFLEYLQENDSTTDSQKKLIDLIRRGYEPGELVDKLGVTRQRIHQMKKQLKNKYSEEYYCE